jgi:hypothetical protein
LKPSLVGAFGRQADQRATARRRAFSLIGILKDTDAPHRIQDGHWPKATCGTIRLKLVKIGALVRVSVRRIKVAMASACPAAHAWGCAARRLAAAANARASPA